jgi:hypothetical protein
MVETNDDNGRPCVEYVILCRFGSSEWHVHRRLSHFVDLEQQLHKLLKKELWGMLPVLPKKQGIFSREAQAGKSQLERYLLRLVNLSKRATDKDARLESEDRESRQN